MSRFKNLISSFIFLMAFQSFAGEKPSWFQADTRNNSGFTFYCEGEMKDTPQQGEKAALAAAEAECSRKMCMLFGVEVDYQQTSRENLKDATVDSVIKESCPKVRISGRTTKKKSVECEEGNCHAYISQVYPLSEYEAEKKRLNNPAIVKELEKTIVIREGNETFKDPKACRTLLKDYSKVLGVKKDDIKKRKDLLTQAQTDCAGLDYRNTDLQSELMGYLIANYTKRSISFANMVNEGLMTQPNFLAKLNYLNEVESEDNDAKVKTAQSVLRMYYDALYYREFPFDGKGFELPGGHITEVHPYLAELKTCNAHAEVVKKWPKNFTDDVSVCLKKYKATGEDCQTTSVIMLRASYAGCVCNLGDPSRSSLCTQQLLSFMNTECPNQMTETCFRQMSKKITEMMKSNMHETKDKKETK